jgi:hypothetical protein
VNDVVLACVGGRAANRQLWIGLKRGERAAANLRSNFLVFANSVAVSVFNKGPKTKRTHHEREGITMSEYKGDDVPFYLQLYT